MLRLIDPCWSRPAIIEPGRDRLEVTARGVSGPARFFLARPGSCLALRPAKSQSADRGRLKAECLLPGNLAPGNWEMVVRDGASSAREPAAIHCTGLPRDDFTFVHASDFHLSPLEKAPAGQAGPAFRTDRLEKMVAAINRLAPAFVITTGDLVSRYRQNRSDILPPERAVEQVRSMSRVMRKISAPLFLNPGNHDLGFPWLRQAWSDEVRFLERGINYDYHFDYADCRFISLEGPWRYDPATGGAIRDGRFGKRQLSRLARTASSGNRKKRFLFFHYDPDRRLLPLLARGVADMVLYGHAARKPLYGAGIPPGVIDGWLPASFQVVKVSPDGISIEPAPPGNGAGK